MRIDRFAAVVSSIGTFSATVIILFTLFELGNQRKSAYKPDLVFGKKDFYIYANKSTNTADIWSPIPLTRSDFKQVKHPTPMLLNLYNIGMGAAKTITANWKLDIDGSINTIKELDTKKQYVIVTENQLLKISHLGHKTWIPIPSADLFDYILPAHVEKEPHKLMLPYLYQFFTSIIFTLSSEKAQEFTYPSSPKFKVILNYFDIGNNEHKKEFSIDIRPGLTILEKDRALAEITGTIELKETK